MVGAATFMPKSVQTEMFAAVMTLLPVQRSATARASCRDGALWQLGWELLLFEGLD